VQNDLALHSNQTSAILAACFAYFLVGCTCTPAGSSGAPTGTAQVAEVTIEAGTAPGALPVTLVLDPTGELCADAARAAGGLRHVVCDRSAEDLSAPVLRQGLARLKQERGAAVASRDVWLLAAQPRAAVARSLAVRDPAFFSRVAVWVGESRPAAGLFGSTFLEKAGKRGLRTVVLLGPGAEEAGAWAELAKRQGLRLRAIVHPSASSDAAVWATLTREFAQEPPQVVPSLSASPEASPASPQEPARVSPGLSVPN